MNIEPRFIVICREAFLTACSNNLNLIGIFTQVNADRFPFPFSHFALVANMDIDTAGAYTIHVNATDPHGQSFARMDMPVTTTAGNWQVIVNFDHVQFSLPGQYAFHVALDETHIGTRVIDVKPVVKSPPRTANIA